MLALRLKDDLKDLYLARKRQALRKRGTTSTVPLAEVEKSLGLAESPDPNVGGDADKTQPLHCNHVTPIPTLPLQGGGRKRS